MLCEELSQFPQRVLPLPCNACVIVTSKRRQNDGAHMLLSSYNFWTAVASPGWVSPRGDN